MIVDPDFMDHWRTGMVADAIQDPMAPIYILRLWAHCQERKSDTFVIPTRGLKAQCKASCDAETFERALVDAGFIERNGDTIKVCGWAEKNASLLAAWENGKKGGRPRKQITQQKPSANPAETQSEPSANPVLTQTKPIRVEKSREEKETPRVSADALAKARASRKCPEGFEPESPVAWIAEHAPGVDWQRETAKFRDHTFKTALADWAGAWRNWMRRAAELKPQARAPTGQSFREREAEQQRALVYRVTGGILGRRNGDHNTIDMEPGRALAATLD